MKKCSGCQILKPFTEFHIRNKIKGSYQVHCKICRKEVDKLCYKNKRSIRIAQKKDRRLGHRKELESYKSERGCKQCGIKHPGCLQFHHRDSKTKEFNVGELVGWSWKKILIEIEKCDILCANCHCILHWEERNRE